MKRILFFFQTVHFGHYLKDAVAETFKRYGDGIARE